MKFLMLCVCCLALVAMVYAEGDSPWVSGHGRDNGGSLDQTWGPDAFGYRAKNQQEADGPTPLWTDISSMGTQVLGLGDDNTVGPFPIGFNFHYYWYDVHQFWVGSNGFIKFSSRGQISSTYSQYPNLAPPNDVVGVYTADWVMSGSNPTDSACYYWSNNTDTLIVMFKNMRAYSNGGSHNFEIILSAVDSSITFQYGTQTGTVSADAIGIENLMGNVGLNTHLNVYPTSNTAVRFSYPDTINYSVQTMQVVAVQNPLSDGYFMRVGDTLRPWAQIANLGYLPQAACSLCFKVLLPNGTPVAAAQDTQVLDIGSMDTLVYTPALQWIPADTGIYLLHSCAYWSTGNHYLRTEVHVVNLPAELKYDDGSSERASGWNSAGRAVAMEFVPPAYPLRITQARAYFSSASAAYDVSILTNDGPDGSPGTEIWRHHMASSTSGWNSVAVPGDSGRINNGSCYIAFWTPSGIQLGFDTTSAQGFSRRAWEYINGWGQNKWWNISDPMIRCSGQQILPPPGAFARLLPVDNSTVPWMQGQVLFGWHPSHDPGAIITYHLYVHSGDYNRAFSTTDTTFSDSLAWFYGGFPTATVTWQVWATNGTDSIQASNGTGTFHLNANHAPGAFMRIAPGDSLLTTGYLVHCSWTRSLDADGNPIRYVFHVYDLVGPDPQPSDTVTSDTTLTIRMPLPIDATAIIHNYYWTVKATDGIDTTNASNGTGHFQMDILDVPDGPDAGVITDYAVRSYPNPFNPTTALSYDLPSASQVELKIYNLAGEQVAVLYQGYQTPGRYHAQWNASAQASGTYFAVLKAGNQTRIHKLLLLK
jgi:hypothetical protein